jgi:hypothetical protein
MTFIFIYLFIYFSIKIFMEININESLKDLLFSIKS